MQEDTTITASLKKSQLLLPLLVLLVVLVLRQQRRTSIFEAIAASFFGLGLGGGAALTEGSKIRKKLR